MKARSRRHAAGWGWLFLMAGYSAMALAADADTYEFEPDIPQVLTPVRLQQPLAEVPAAVTVITAEQIRLWGVTDIPSVFRFVPGLFVARELDSDRASVVYHSGGVSLARRLEVLVDGRSVYKAAFANVDWDQLGIALEDVERIEITRGPSAASYGMNALQGVIHIITRHPADSARVHLGGRLGSEQRRQFYASLTQHEAQQQSRISLFGWREGEHGGYHADAGDQGGLPDLRQVRGVNWSGAWQADMDNELRWQFGRQELQRDYLADSNFQVNSPQQAALSDLGWLRWRSQRSADHEVQLQAYWQADNSEVDYRACAPAMAFDAQLSELYQQHPQLAEKLGYGLLPLQNPTLSSSERSAITQQYQGLAVGAFSAAELQQGLGLENTISAAQYSTAQQIVQRAVAANALDQALCGQGNLDVYEQRIDLEWQDTRRWSEQLRSVQGIGLRRDQVDSATYLQGGVRSDQWLAFISAEYRPAPYWLLSAGMMAQYQTGQEANYLPRLALSFLPSADQSIRVLYSHSQRTPDIAERYLNGRAVLTDVSSHYLNLNPAGLFINANADNWRDDLRDERIQAWELGYFIHLPQTSLQLDIKAFREHMTDLIGSTVTLRSTSLTNEGQMTLKGIESQLQWQPSADHRIWLTLLRQQRDSSRSGELVLGAESSARLVWTHHGEWQEQMLGIFWDNSEPGYDPGYAAQGRYRQQRLLARWSWHTWLGDWSLSSEYDALHQQVLYETTPRWLNRLGWQMSW
ncbi:MAG: TonB-dependent receptor [Saccharospirillaceae bacterium]|nr:TonB-dependent receptor [Saccharospirillaceae bacterium]MCD8532966.1 TonB-dependent receptor [Saccharospirillaceae bacterium]